MRSFRFLISYIIIIAFSIIFVLEYCIRILHLAPALPPFYAAFVNDGCLPFREKPNSVRRIQPWPEGYEFEFVCVTNSQGFRDTEHDFDKTRGKFRILTLGDSFTFGAGASFEGTYPYQLQKMLNESENKLTPVEVINAGQRRYWPQLERLLLETIGIKYSPDLILAEFTPNDITDTRLGLNFNSVRNGYLVSPEGYELGQVGTWLYVNSHVCRKIIRLYLDQKHKHVAYLKEIKWEEIFKPRGHHENDWLSVELEYRQMLQIANKIGAQLMLVYIPSKPYENDYASKRLIEWGERNGVLVVNTLPAINNASLREKVYWTKDIHCTEAGYRVIAEIIYSELIEKKLIPKPKN